MEKRSEIRIYKAEQGKRGNITRQVLMEGSRRICHKMLHSGENINNISFSMEHDLRNVAYLCIYTINLH
jgi:hypothetical protein